MPLSYQTLDFHNHEYEVIAGPNTAKFMYGFCFGRENEINKREEDIKDPRSHITIRNFRLSGNPRAAFDIYYCHHITIENLDLEMDLSQGKGLNFRHGSFLSLSGDIYIRGGNSHGIDIVGCSNVTIGDVTITHTDNGCAVLLSNNHNVSIGNVIGYKNDPQGSYATLRFANGNVNSAAQGVYSRNSGKGIMVSSGESGWEKRPPESGWTTPGNHNNRVHKADILRSSGPSVFMNAPSSNNEVKYLVLRDAKKVKGGGLTMIRGTKNRVGENTLPTVHIDSSKTETVRINELRFGFNDCSPFEYFGVDGTDKYVRERSCDGYGYAKVPRAEGSEISWTINGGRGTHRFGWRHATRGDVSAKLYINGLLHKKPLFTGSGSEGEWQTTMIEAGDLDSGPKLIKLVATTNKGLPLIDYLEVTGPGVQPSLVIKKMDDKQNCTRRTRRCRQLRSAPCLTYNVRCGERLHKKMKYLGRR
ncbi:MAG: hypothetical protein CMH43_00570 [Micrococcales bacterium]|nr:hypothetical protein [Micrococcales bacterium]